MKTNRADRLADALLLQLPATDRRTLLELSEPEKFIAKVMRRQPDDLIRDAHIPTSAHPVRISSSGTLK